MLNLMEAIEILDIQSKTIYPSYIALTIKADEKKITYLFLFAPIVVIFC